MRLQYKKAIISDNGQYLVYQCCNLKVYRVSIMAVFNLQNNGNNGNTNTNINSFKNTINAKKHENTDKNN